ncbi:MFS transporter [Streptococcus troglodytae]
MKAFMEKFSLLSLSLMLVSTFAVSPALPKMLSFYQTRGYSNAQVELLLSLSSFAILTVLLLNPWLNRWLSERWSIVLGLLLLSIGGILPVFLQFYPLVFLSRLLLGFGIGLINARAISMISERFSGQTRVQMLGLRGSAEVLGSALLTFLAGQWLNVSWSFAFLIYGFGFLILLCYLLFVPAAKRKREHSQKQLYSTASRKRLTFRQLFYIFGLALYAGFVILVNSANTLRIPLVVERLHLGTASQASFILSLMMLMGILAGILFSFLLALFKDYLMSLVVFVLGLGMLILWQANHLWFLGLGALVTGFVYSLGVTLVFHLLSEHMPRKQLTTATTLILIGCNLGGGCASFALQLFARINSDVKAAFLIFAVLSLILGILLLIRVLKTNRKLRK